MDAEDEKQPAGFKLMKSMLEAGELRAGLDGIEDRIELVVALRVLPDADSEIQPAGGIHSLSTLDTKPHRQLLMEATQQFAKASGYPLEMMVLNKQAQQG